MSVLAGLTLLLLVVFQRYFRGTSRWSKAGWALLIGGIAGNLADRIRVGSVIDFLDFYMRLGDHFYHWPAFNIADSAICAGVCCYLIESFRSKKPPAEELEQAGASS